MRIHQNVKDWERVASVVAGLGLVALAVKSPRFRRVATTTGAGLVARGLSGLCPVNAALGRTRTNGRAGESTRAALSGARGIRMDAGIRIDRPVEEVFEFWRDVTNLPMFMSHVERVDPIGASRSHWVVRGPAGLTLEWDAELINEEPPRLIAWRSVSPADVASAGSVHFEPLADGGTRVDVALQYSPPAGKIGAGLATLAGHSPDSILREDLRRLKHLLESGRVRAQDEQSQSPGQPPSTRRRFSHQF